MSLKKSNFITWKYVDPDTKECYATITQEHDDLYDGPWGYDTDEISIDIVLRKKDSMYV